jgi:isochorismate synthase
VKCAPKRSHDNAGRHGSFVMNAVNDAIHLARLQRDGKSWLIVAESVELGEDPTPWFTKEAGRGRVLGWMRDGWLVAAGEAFAVEADGPGRFVAVAEAAAHLEGRCVVDAPAEAGDLPRLVVSIAFGDSVDGPAWQGIAAARVLLPRRTWLRRQDGSTWCIRAAAVSAEDSTEAVEQRLREDPPPVTRCQPLPWDDPAIGFTELVEDAAALVADGGLRKVVLARAVDEPCTHSTENLIPRLRASADPDALVYAIDLPDGGCFLGATPELLFAADGCHVQAMALAGSRRRDDDPAVDDTLRDELFASTKERKEHQLVVEHVAAVLSARGTGTVVPTSPRVRTLPRLHHLETKLSVELMRPAHLELLGALHPTPAICGLPVAGARSYILRRERLRRGLYAGALGFLDRGRARFWVPLRGGILRDGRCRLFAGAGIVETSDPEQELAETETKLSVMRSVIR